MHSNRINKITNMQLRSGKIVNNNVPMKTSFKAKTNKLVNKPTNIIYYTDGGYYIGDIQNGKPHGKGTMYFKNGNILKANSWRKGRAHGYGNYDFGNGKMYHGMFKDGHRHGWGMTMWNDNQNVTRGFWKNSGLTGYGFRQFVNTSGKTSFCFGKFVERKAATCFTYTPDSHQTYLTHWKKGEYDHVRTITNPQIIQTLQQCFDNRSKLKERDIEHVMKNVLCPKVKVNITI